MSRPRRMLQRESLGLGAAGNRILAKQGAVR
jgi:hypothetical protein